MSEKKEERRQFYCMNHRPPQPILKLVVTLEATHEQETLIELGSILCGTCKKPPVLQEIAQDRMPKATSRILQRSSSGEQWH